LTTHIFLYFSPVNWREFFLAGLGTRKADLRADAKLIRMVDEWWISDG
jgi:hypothetical protein